MAEPIADYDVKKNLVRYACPNCGDRLTSELADAGLEDRCRSPHAFLLFKDSHEKLKAEEQWRITRAEELATRRSAQELKEQKQQSVKARTVQAAC